MTRLRLSRHFTVEEFDSRDGARVPAVLVPGLRFLVAWWLQPMRNEFGPVRVASGYRSPRHNASVGGARASIHLGLTLMPSTKPAGLYRAAASDVICARGNVASWVQWAERRRAQNPHLGGQGRGGIGRYPRLGFVHLDTGPRRDWNG